MNVHRHPDLLGDPAAVRAGLEEKCAHAGIEVPTADSISNSPFREELEQEWANMLGHQLPHLPPVAEFWDGLSGVFGWLAGEPLTVLDRAPIDASIDAAWVPPRAMTT